LNEWLVVRITRHSSTINRPSTINRRSCRSSGDCRIPVSNRATRKRAVAPQNLQTTEHGRLAWARGRGQCNSNAFVTDLSGTPFAVAAIE
jgi:hypothetical protein